MRRSKSPGRVAPSEWCLSDLSHPPVLVAEVSQDARSVAVGDIGVAGSLIVGVVDTQLERRRSVGGFISTEEPFGFSQAHLCEPLNRIVQQLQFILENDVAKGLNGLWLIQQ